mmetsp:Transcript_124501/g.363540  ORF Transcript_124501/g.363540 Transcript_124501/m.363540 type:complete len:91 (-) Transcript_124501:39-311(-)
MEQTKSIDITEVAKTTRQHRLATSDPLTARRAPPAAGCGGGACVRSSLHAHGSEHRGPGVARCLRPQVQLLHAARQAEALEHAGNSSVNI